MRVGIDVLYGTGMGYLDTYFKDLGLPTIVLHDWRDVRFGGDSPEPGETQLQELKKVVRTKKCAVGFGTDGDADRFGIMDQDGSLLTPNEILPILLQHLVKTRKWKGFVARSVMTSHFLDAVAKHYGLEVKETPVGFKYIAKAMKDSEFVMGGEESGGFTIRGHVPEKDGVLACALMAEVRALEKKSFRQILKELQKKVGSFLTDRINFHLSAEHMARLQKQLQTYTPSDIGGKRVHQIVRMDGYKFVFDDQSWMGIRLSGTEPVVRLYLEASTQKKLAELKKIGEAVIQQEK
jgi:phosphoglucomutase